MEEKILHQPINELLMREQTARAEAEASQRRYRDLLHRLDAIVWEADPTTLKLTFVSQRAEAMLGYPLELWLGNSAFWTNLTHPADREYVLAQMRASIKAQQDHTFERRAIAAHGNVIWLRTIVHVARDPNGHPQHLRGLTVDVSERRWAEEALRRAHTELERRVEERTAELARANTALQAEIRARQQAEEALRESKNRYQLISELTSDYGYAFRVEADGSLICEWVTEAFARITGFTTDEVQAQGGWPILIHPDDMPIAQQRHKRLMAGEVDASEFRIITKSGTVCWLRDYGRPVWDEAHTRVIRIYGAARDITARKEIEAQLRQAEAKYRVLVEQLPAVTYSASMDGSLAARYVSPQIEALLGFSQEEWLANPGLWVQQLHADDRERVLKAYQICRTTGQPFHATYRLLTCDGRIIWIRDEARVVRDDAHNTLCLQGLMLETAAPPPHPTVEPALPA